MTTRTSTLGILTSLALCFGACGECEDATQTIDAGVSNSDANPDATPVDLPPLMFDIAGVGSGPADLTCLGVRATPPGGEEVEVTMSIVPFGAPPEARVPDAVVQIFHSNRVAAGDICPAPDCEQRTADSAGDVTTTLARGGWFAYRVLPVGGTRPDNTFLRTIETNLTPPEPGGRIETFNTISLAVISGLAAQAGVELTLGTGIISGAVLDCQGRPLQGAIVRLFTGSGREVTGDAATERYFDGELPPGIDSERRFTSNDGRYAVISAPADLASRIEVWGVQTVDEMPQLIACESVNSIGDTLSVLPILPLRSDAPSRCGQVPFSR